jgi:AAA domain
MTDSPRSAERSPFKSGQWKKFVFDPAGFVPPEQPIYDGLLARGDLAIWLGREKHRKSSVLLQFAICAALGRAFLHFQCRPGQTLKVVMLDYESKTQTLKQRFDAIVQAMQLNKVEQEILRTNLRIVEMRKAFRHGLKFVRFPVKPEKGEVEEFTKAEEEWRSFVRETAADLYIIDPMRCMHAQAENDSALEALLTRVHQIFGDAAVVISHHLRKRDRRGEQKLTGDMRIWADEARGSSAITAHADVIICQERVVEGGMETLHLGAYLRDGADIEPIILRETDLQSFLWKVAPDIPPELTECLDALRGSGGKFPNRTAAAAVLQQNGVSGRSTAFTRLKDLLNRGLLSECDGALKVKEIMDEADKTH